VYLQSMQRNFLGFATARTFVLADRHLGAMQTVAHAIQGDQGTPGAD